MRRAKLRQAHDFLGKHEWEWVRGKRGAYARCKVCGERARLDKVGEDWVKLVNVLLDDPVKVYKW